MKTLTKIAPMTINTNMKTSMMAAIAIACHATMSASVPMIDAVTPYVYPANTPKSPAAMSYMPDGLSYVVISPDGTKLLKQETSTGKQLEVVMDVTKTRDNTIEKIAGFILSADGQKALVYAERRAIYRHSFEAEFYVLDIRRNILTPLSAEHKWQQAPTFSPDARMVAFVADNNIYIKKLDYDSEVAVTKDGVKNKIINGVPDWTYQEEFSTLSSLSWSPDNSAICYLKWNEREVPEYSFPLYQGACDPKDEYALYPGTFTYKYPVAGERNSTVTLHCYEIDNRTTKEIKIGSGYEYIPRISYARSNPQLMIVTLNRDQNEMRVFSANPKSTVVTPVLTERSDAWLSDKTYEGIEWNDNNFVIQSARSGYNHLYQYAYNGSLQRQITSGEWNVTANYGTDQAGNRYIQSTSGGAINRVLSKIDTKGKKTDISPLTGTSSAVFAPGMQNYIMCYSDATTPQQYVMYNSKQKRVREIEMNDSMALLAKSLPTKEFFTFKSDNETLNGYMVKPLDFSTDKKYPVIMWQYSGPESQEVLNRWHLDWEVAAAENGFVVVCVDGRGTGGRDRKFTEIVYRDLGHYETIDQVNAARYIASLPWADKARIGIAGWSYGGYETLMAASAEGDNPYKAAVAIAPVTDWRYYDTVYAERFMLTPNGNKSGYQSSAPLNKISSMNTCLLLMSGTADDNVHMSNTVEYVARLIAAKKRCDMMIFPNMNHSINGCDARAVVYGNMLDFFTTHLK